MIVDVIPITRLPRHLPVTFSYAVPIQLRRQIETGQIIEVSFRTRLSPAVVIRTKRTTGKIKQLKTIRRILTPKAFVTKKQLEIAHFIASKYFVSPATALLGIVPQLPKKIGAVSWPLKTSKKKQLKGLGSQLIWSGDNNLDGQIKKLINKLTAHNRQVLYLVPERLQARQIYNQLSNLHILTLIWRENLNKKELLANWLSVMGGQANIIIGTRSALFTPFVSLDLIIMANEPDDAYKSEQTPRFQTREVVRELARLHSAKLLYLTAAPSLATYIEQKEGNNTQVGRLAGNISVVDIKEERLKENFSDLSDKLQAAIATTLKNKHQVFLFLNRKGHSTSVTCHDCAYTIICPNCRLPLVYHTSNSRLICHHCRYKEDMPPLCPKCNSAEIKLTGKGVQKIERTVKKLFPKTRVRRLDKDAETKTYSLAPNIYNIIIGTEYALARLNWQKIGLLGIINADTAMYRADFRASERTYQLLVKLAAKSYTLDTKLIIQTYNPENYVIKAIAKNDPKIFYDTELKLRKSLGYPPFKKIIKLIYRHANEKKAAGEAMHIFNRLCKHLLSRQATNDRQQTTNKVANRKSRLGCDGLFVDSLEIIKPFPALERKSRGKFQFHLIVKFNPETEEIVNKKIRELIPPDWVVDVDPETLL